MKISNRLPFRPGGPIPGRRPWGLRRPKDKESDAQRVIVEPPGGFTPGLPLRERRFLRLLCGKSMTPTSYTIRAYAPDDDPAPLSALWYAASLEAHAFLGPEKLQEQRTQIETLYLPKAETWQALAEDGTPLGFIGLLGGYVGGLFVAPEAQGRGVGRALLDHARARHGALELEVYVENARALRVYLAYGFREVSRRELDDEGLPHANILLKLDA